MFQRFFSILHYCKTWSYITVSNESQNVLKGTSVGRYSDSLVPIPTPLLSHTFWTLWKSDIRSCKPNSTLRHVYRQSIGHISCFSMLKKSVIRSCNTPRSSPPHPHNMYWSIYVYEIRSCKPFTVLLFRCWNHILGLVDLSLTRWNQVL